jgi:hypothetical protein
MAKPSIDAEFALHEFSVKYRAGLAKAGSANALQSFLGGVKEDFAQEQQANRDQAIEPPAAANEHKMEDPDEGR